MTRTIAACLAACVLTLTACGNESDWGTVTEAAGERQRVECRGTVTPAVVLVHGIGDRAGSASWSEVLDLLPDDRRVCRYDRPGAGDSPAPRASGRDGTALAAELDAVVAEAGAPVVLAGHSFGSYPVLIYTAAHRDRVAGVVLVDGVDPAFGLLPALGAGSWADVSMAKEGLALETVERQARDAVARPDVFAGLPLTVLRRGENATDAWIAAQQRLAGLSPRGELRVADGAGHQIPADDPDAVVAAITRS
ncbi:alpha/beta fold hydrolase [Catenuloplanes atrovinosus]|uniref:Pimeloyl-ACP methyl ester carboxylesterase n=1 Tax=Catenuloplanes atrovinosus TaxID=137266 RepID=A0AAE3YNW3_9ACTN|nr:alpha/beta fold hydrolase [Catenuloplanes atrovinosus]MDR7275196.1 pimeloyl-ACP methyl ester carboxylesterase [Catenuloplanes atrovinosus]